MTGRRNARPRRAPNDEREAAINESLAAVSDLPTRLVNMPLADLVPYDKNARTHSDEQVSQIADSIREFGFVNPILADGFDIVAGHGRMMAVKKIYESGDTIKLPDGSDLPSGFVPVLDVSGWTEAQRRAYIVADNRLAELAGWDFSILSSEMAELKALGYDTALTGFTDDDIAEFAESLEDEPSGRSTESVLDVLSVTIADPVHEVKRGDVWRLSKKHILVCANVMKEWDQWTEFLIKDKSILLPYPGMLSTQTALSETHNLVLVQPDIYVAGKIIDIHANVHGEDSVKLEKRND